MSDEPMMGNVWVNAEMQERDADGKLIPDVDQLKAKVARDFLQMVERETIDTARHYKFVNGAGDGDRGWVNLRMQCLQLAMAEQQGGYPTDINAIMQKAYRYWRWALYAETAIADPSEEAAPTFDLRHNRF